VLCELNDVVDDDDDDTYISLFLYNRGRHFNNVLESVLSSTNMNRNNFFGICYVLMVVNIIYKTWQKVMIKIIQGSAVTRTVLGGLTKLIYLLVASFVQCMGAKNYESQLAVDKVIATISRIIFFWPTLCICYTRLDRWTGVRAALTGDEVGKADGEDCNETAIDCLAESPIL